MFGNRKRREERKAAEAVARESNIAERAEVLAGLQESIASIEAISDEGVKLFALEEFHKQIGEKIEAEKKKGIVKGGLLQDTIIASSAVLFTLGTASAVAAPFISVPLIALALPASGAYAIGGALLNDKIKKNKLAKLKDNSFYDPDFVATLEKIQEETQSKITDIVDNGYEDLTSSKFFNDVMQKYPSIKKTFLEWAVKGLNQRNTDVPPPPASKQDDKGFSL